MSQEWYEIEVQGYDWVYVITKLLKAYTQAGRGIEVVVSEDNTQALFQIPRQLVPASAIAKAIGASEEMVRTKNKIRLIPFKRMADWQTPTVGYFGEA